MDENKLKPCVVLYQDWQMDCCGTPFRPGDRVEWPVVVWNSQPVDNNTFDPVSIVGPIDYLYEAHGCESDTLFTLTGTVDRLEGLYCEYITVGQRPKVLVPVSGILREMDVAKGFEEPVDGLEFSDYIVHLKDWTITPY